MDDRQLHDLLSQIRDEIRYGNHRDGSDLSVNAINAQIADSITVAVKEFKEQLIAAEREAWEKKGKSEKQIENHLKSKAFQKKIEIETQKERPNIEKGVEKKVRGAARQKAFENLSGRNGARAKAYGQDISRFGNSVSAMAGNKGAISKVGTGIANLGKAFSKFSPIIGGVVQVTEFAISKATEYMKVGGENLMKEMSTITTVSTNAMRGNLSSWKDAMDGAYESQSLQIESALELTKASNAIELANTKLANTWTNWIPIIGALNKMEEEEMAMRQQVAEAEISNAQKIIAQVTEFTKRTDDYIKKQDDIIHQYQRLNSLSSQQTAIFEKRMLSEGESLAKFNRTIEDALKMQNSVHEQSGRTVNYSNEDYEKSVAVGSLVGDDNLTNFQVQMVLFNHSISGSADIMYDMYRDANKMALSSQKLTKSVLGNLKLAEKYSFKNGIKGFIEMSKWAENVRFNMGSLGNMLEKQQSGGLEGTITQAAKLQVLGGNFAMGADPLAMAYEAFNDPDAYAKRAQKMLSGLGTIDRKTGETSFNAADTMRIRAYAEAMGMSTEDAMNMVRESNRKGVVKKQMRNSTLNTKQQDAVANKAQRDEKTGQWYVQTIAGKRIDVNDIKEGDIENILSNNTEEQSTQYSKNTMSLVQQIEASTKEINSKLGNLTFDNFAEITKTNIQNMLDAYTTNLDTIAQTVVQQRIDASNEQKTLLNNLNTIFTDYTNSLNVVSKAQENAAKALEEMKADLAKKDAEKAANRANTEKEQQGYQNDYDNASNFISKAWAKGRLAEGEALKQNGGKRDSFTSEGLSAGWTGFKTFVSALFDDGAVSANGNPMAVAASRVIPIHDGAVASSGSPISLAVPKATVIHDGTVSSKELPMMVSASNVAPIRDGAVAANGNPMAVAASRVTQIRDGAVASSGSPISLAVPRVTPIHDGAVSSDGLPMTVSASNVTPIHDGEVAKTDSQDHAIFAKVGGPFDKLFNGVFERINAVYDAVSQMRNQPKENSIRYYAENARSLKRPDFGKDPLAESWAAFNKPIRANDRMSMIARDLGHYNRKTGEMEYNTEDLLRLRRLKAYGNETNGMQDDWHSIRDYVNSNESVFSRTNYNNSIVNRTNRNDYSNVQPRAMVFGEMPRGNNNVSVGGSNGSETKNNTPIKIEPITLNINLGGNLGRSSSFMEELENDPIFRRSLVRIITTELSIRTNGGKAVYNGGL